MRTVEIDPAQMRSPADHRCRSERAETGDDANREGEAQNHGSGHGEKLSRISAKNEARQFWNTGGRPHATEFSSSATSEAQNKN